MTASAADDVALLDEIRDAAERVRTELAKRIVGQKTVIDDLLACFLAGGHSLLIGVPGLAKTMLVQSLARSLDLDFNRVQFTPDLMPSDITGSEILFEDKASGYREFKFIKGPLFTNILLADEINRTPPKTQSALLQAMQEGEVTSSGRTYPLPAPFWVLATQNPIEQEGTYPLPEAQLDRFMFSIEIDYPDAAAEIQIVRMTTREEPAVLHPVATAGQLASYRSLIRRMPLAETVLEYAVSLVRLTRPVDNGAPPLIRQYVTWGAGPRASQYLVLAAKAYAALDGRPTPDLSDVRRAAYPVLRHRLVRSFSAEIDGISANDIIAHVISAARQQ